MYSKSKRFIASFLAVLMAVCLLPMDVASVAYAEELSVPQIETPADTDEPAGIVEETEEVVDSDTDIDDEESSEEVDIDTADKDNAEEAASKDGESDEAVTATDDENVADVVASEEEYSDAATPEYSVAEKSGRASTVTADGKVNKVYVLDFDDLDSNSSKTQNISDAEEGDMSKTFTLAGTFMPTAEITPLGHTSAWAINGSGTATFTAVEGSTVEMLIYAKNDASKVGRLAISGKPILVWSSPAGETADGTVIKNIQVDAVNDDNGDAIDRLYKVTVELGQIANNEWIIQRAASNSIEMHLFYIKVTEPTEVTGEDLSGATAALNLTADQDGWTQKDGTWTKTYTGDKIIPAVSVTDDNGTVDAGKYNLTYARSADGTAPEAGDYQAAKDFDFESAGTIYIKVNANYDSDGSKSPATTLQYVISKAELEVDDPETISLTFDDAGANDKTVDLAGLFKDIKGDITYALSPSTDDSGESVYGDVVASASMDAGSSVVKYTVASVASGSTPDAAALKVNVTLQNYDDVIITINIEMGNKEEITFELEDIEHIYGNECDFVNDVVIKSIAKKDTSAGDFSDAEKEAVEKNIRANLECTFTAESAQAGDGTHIHAGDYTVTATLGGNSKYTIDEPVTVTHTVSPKTVYIKAKVSDWDKSLAFAPVSRPAKDSSEYEFVAAPASENEPAVTADEDNVNLGLVPGDAITTQPTIVYYATGTTTPMTTTTWSALAVNDTVDVALVGAKANTETDYDIKCVKASLKVKKSPLDAVSALKKNGSNTVIGSDSASLGFDSNNSTESVTSTDGFLFTPGFKTSSTKIDGESTSTDYMQSVGAGKPTEKSIAFTTVDKNADLTIKVSPTSKNQSRNVVLAYLDSNATLTEAVGKEYTVGESTAKQTYDTASKLLATSGATNLDSTTYTVYDLAPATYYIYSASSGVNFYEVTVTYKDSTPTPPTDTVEAPTFNPTVAADADPFEYTFLTSEGDVEIDAEDATVYYVLSTDTGNYNDFVDDADLTVYTTKGTPYTGKITVTDGLTIKAVAVKDGKASKVVTSPKYNLGTMAPLKGTITATPSPENSDITEGDDNVIVKLTYDKAADEAEATVKFLYTVGTDESAVPAFNALPANTPATGSSNYVDTTGIEIPATTAGKIYVKVLAYTETTTGEGENATTTVTALASTPASFEYTVKSAKVAPAMPTATVNGNAVANDGNVTVTESATVALASADSADIYYTDNNSTPDSSSTKYEGSFTVTATKTIKAIAIKDGLSSDVLTFTVTVNSNSYDDEGDEENEYNDWWTEDRAEIKEKNNGKIPAGLWIAGIYSEGYDYTGDKITPYVRVYHNVHLLAEKIDYTISYKNNVNVPTTDAANKQPTIVVKGKGNYAKQATETFKINPRSMGDESVYIDEMTVLAKKNGAALKPVPTVILSYWLNDDVEKERKLKNKKEFEVKYCTEAEYDAAESLDKITGTDSVSEPGSYRMIVTGKGNYSGISSASLEVLKSDAILASKLKVKVGKITYSKDEAEKVGFEGFKPSVEVTAGKTKLTEDTDYTLYYRNNYEAGTAYVTISPVAKTTGEGEDATTTYAFYGSRTVAFTITGKPIKSAKVTVKPEALTYSYNWDGIIDSSDITLEYKGTSLSQGEDYGISWIQNNYAAGKATIYIYGNGEYTGELKKVVKINPRDLSDSSISVTPDTISGAFSKGGTRPVITVKYTYDAENEYSYNLVEGRDYTVTYKNNNNFKKSPSLVIKGKGNFKGSINKTFTFATKDISEVYFDVPNVVVNKGGKYGSKPVLSDRNGTKEVKLAVKKDYTLAYYDMTEKADEPSTEADGDNEDKEEGTPISNINKFTDGKAGSVIKVVATAVEGSGYTGKATRYYSIRENDFGKVKIKVANKEFTGKAVTLTADDITITGATLTLQESADSETDGYYIDPASYVNNIKKGTAKVTLIGTGKYAGSKTVSFKITAKEVKWDRGTTNE